MLTLCVAIMCAPSGSIKKTLTIHQVPPSVVTVAIPATLSLL